MSQRSSLYSFGMFVVVALCAALSARADAPPGHYALGTGTVYDTKTGLTWQQALTEPGGAGGSGGAGGGGGWSEFYEWSDAKMHCTNLNLNGFGWRLPTVKELLTIVDVTKQDPSIDTSMDGFPETPSDNFWSATPNSDSGVEAWVVNFGNGSTDLGYVGTDYRVRCVR